MDNFWKEYTELEQLQMYYSDYHKDMFGFRPRNYAGWTVEDFHRELAALDKLDWPEDNGPTEAEEWRDYDPDC